jgi:hypothetical protein
LAIEPDCRLRTNAQLYDLLTGKLRRRVRKSPLNDSSNHSFPAPIRNSVSTLNRNSCYFNLVRCESYLAYLKELAEAGDEEAANHYKNDSICLRRVSLSMQPYDSDSGIYKCSNIYSTKSTGRIYGGFQNFSRGMKYEAFNGLEIEGRPIINYDLKSSQLNGLIEVHELAGVDASLWLDLMSNRDNYAIEIVGDRDLFKTLLFSILFGGKTNNSDRAPSSASATLRAIRNYVYKHEKDPELQKLKIKRLNFRFNNFIQPYEKSLDEFRNYLDTDYFEKYKKHHSGTGYYIENACGMKFYRDEHTKAHLRPHNATATRRKELAAHILQGREAAYIHHLTVLGDDYDYRVIANEHDGVIVLNEIPKEAQDRAKELSGFHRALLIKKPFENRNNFDVLPIAA